MTTINLLYSFLRFLAANKDAFIALGVLVGAMTAVGTSWWVSRAAHRSMVSQMRERWIEALRSEVAELNGLALLFARKQHDSSFNAFDYLHKSQILGNRIILRLNSKNESHAKLETAVRQFMLAKTDPERDARGDELLLAAREVIQKTWSKAERGEL
jgi:hypothetical protein